MFQLGEQYHIWILGVIQSHHGGFTGLNYGGIEVPVLSVEVCYAFPRYSALEYGEVSINGIK